MADPNTALGISLKFERRVDLDGKTIWTDEESLQERVDEVLVASRDKCTKAAGECAMTLKVTRFNRDDRHATVESFCPISDCPNRETVVGAPIQVGGRYLPILDVAVSQPR